MADWRPGESRRGRTPPPHAGPPHAGPPHAGPPHAGPPHAGPPDAEPLHAGPSHAGRSRGAQMSGGARPPRTEPGRRGGTREYRAGLPPGGPPGEPQPVRLTRRGKILVWVAAAASVLVVVVSLGAYAIYAKLDGNLSVTDAFGGLKNRPPPSARGVQNFLILGSQTRDGQGAGFGYDPGTDLSDNLILVHVNAAHTHATIVSIPRDTMVYEPACRARTGGGTVPAIPQAIIDGAMKHGGTSLAVDD